MADWQLPTIQVGADPADPRVEVPTPQLSATRWPIQALPTIQISTPRRLTGRRELAEEQPDGAQDYRTRWRRPTPDDVRNAALCEVGKLERTSDQSPDSAEIRIWLDTILDLPWSTKTTDWMDIQESREVEATLRS